MKNQVTGHTNQLNFEFIAQGYSKYLQCKFCTNLMTDAKRFFPCGHTFCHQCTQAVQNQSKKQRECFQCSAIIKQIQPDFLVKNLVGQLSVKCLNQDCGYKGEYEQYLQKHCKNCSKQGISKWLKQIGNYANKKNPKKFDQSFDSKEQNQGNEQKIEKDIYQQFEKKKCPPYELEEDDKELLLKAQLKKHL